MLDPRLRFLRSQASDRGRLARLATKGHGIEVEGKEPPRVHVLVQVADDEVADTVKKIPGLAASRRSGRVMSSVVELDRLADLDRVEGVTYVEAARPMKPELERSVPEINATAVHTGPPGRRGQGAVVGIIDTGIDWRHRTFRDANGNSRILRIWDQSLTPVKGESAPAGYSYGVEYDQAQINNALKAADPLSLVRHMDSDGHGTHVAGIAAGRGITTTDQDRRHVGVAPEADLVIVGPIMDTAQTLDAINYVFATAKALGKPAVINLSQGSSDGPHDGTGLFEQGIDNALGTAGRALIKSAGNSADDDIHASGAMTSGGSSAVQFEVPPSDSEEDWIELWYDGDDRISVTITPPGGTASASIAPGTVGQYYDLSNGNRVWASSVLKHQLNGDNQIQLVLDRGGQATIAEGIWTLTLTGDAISTSGGWHAWITSGGADKPPKFIGAYRNSACTITSPGTSKEVISVASYITYNGDGVDGELSKFSCRGPTRDGRDAPMLAAPGEYIVAAKVNADGNVDSHHSMHGTSMAAPHIAGVCALMLQANSNLTQGLLRDCLTASARSDKFTGATPNHDWGGGKVDARAAVDRATKLGTASGWSYWEVHPSVCKYGASAAAWDAYRVDAFFVGSDDALYQRTWDRSSGWHPFVRFQGAYVGAPGVVSRGPGLLDVFAINASNKAVHHLAGNGKAWLPPADLGFVAEHGVAAASRDINVLDVFTIGADGALHHKSRDGQGWSEWTFLGGRFRGAPAAISWGPDRMDVFAIGQDNTIRHRAWDGKTWNEWTSLGGSCQHGVTVASQSPGNLELFTINIDGGLYQKSYMNGAWGDWSVHGGTWVASPGAASWAPGRLDVFTIGTDRQLYHRWTT